MTPAEAANLAATALTAYQHVRTVAAMPAKERGAMMDLWGAVLGDLDYATVHAALLRHVGTSEFFPTVAELRRIASEATTGRARTGLDAWGEVKRAIGAVGRYRQPAFADPLVARCVEAIGWVAICDSEDEMVERAHFVRAYDAMAGKAAEDRSVASLPGVARPALPPMQRVHALREGERRALAPANEGTWPVDQRTPRDDSAPARVGDVLRTLPGGAP
jgi:hypothetical protein